jgi:ApbE superfamily uncharacterized protein (UPF0280 family)
MAASQGTDKSPLAYQERTYRRVEQSGLVSSIVKMAETDLHILASEAVENPALQLIARVRGQIEQYIREQPEFLDALVPLPLNDLAPEPVRQMLAAARSAGVGPMAAVAGVVAEEVGRGLLADNCSEVIVENGGDLFVARVQPCTVAVYAGQSPLSGKLAIRLQPAQMPCGVCCSSGTIGHSLSLGTADAVVVVASSTALADAAATRLANEVQGDRQSMNTSLALAAELEGISGVVIVSGDQLGAWGEIELVKL